MSALQSIWFALIAVLLVGYTILDGFDLGVGFWSLFTKKEEAKRTLMNAIAPFWDGNEVWLLTAGGALFAAFPPVYASVFSGFYLALMLLLMALILRAVSLEFRARETTPGAKAGWDLAFGLGSALAALLLGVAFGNILRGLPLNAQGDFTGNFFTLLNPFALLVGLLNVAMIATHGALYLVVKTEGALQAQAQRWAKAAWWAYLPLAAATLVVAAGLPHLSGNYLRQPLLWALPALAIGTVVTTGLLHNRDQAKPAFAASATSIGLLLVTAATALFPRLVPALGRTQEFSLTAWNSSSSPLTLQVMLGVALVGMSLVAVYTTWVYKTFGGKVKGDVHY